MAIGSGAGAYFGISAESTWGTYVAPTRFLPGNFTVKAEHQTVPVGGYAAAGRLGPVDEIETLLWGTGHYEGEVLRTGYGLLLQHVTGGSAVPVQQAATAAYLQTHEMLFDAHNHAFRVLGGVPRRGIYDNLWTPPGQGAMLTAGGMECVNLSGLLLERSRSRP